MPKDLSSAPSAEHPAAQRQTLLMTAALFLSYLAVSMSLPVVTVYVTRTLGLNNAWGGLAVGISFLSTILTRNLAGRQADRQGGKSAMLRGLGIYSVASVICMLSAWHGWHPVAAFVGLLCGRLLLGLGESQTVVGMLSWGVAVSGPQRAGKFMALMGAGMYGSFALGAPLGLELFTRLGFAGLMAVCVVAPLIGLAMVRGLQGVAPHHGERESFWRVIGRIWQPGMAVGLQGVGFAALGAFFTLYFFSRHWPYAGWGLTLFAVGFVLSRLFFGHLPDQFGGVRVAVASLAVETLGQMLLWLAGAPWFAFAGALLTGLGCSMVFPSMGVEVVRRVPPQLRATAMGGFSAFQDLAYALTGPVAGLFANRFGYASVFLIGAVCAAAGLVMAVACGRAGAGAPAAG